MPSHRHAIRTGNNTTENLPYPMTPLDLGLAHSSSDCHRVVVRLRKQAECLEEILVDIRREIDEIESAEIIDRTREDLFETEP